MTSLTSVAEQKDRDKCDFGPLRGTSGEDEGTPLRTPVTRRGLIKGDRNWCMHVLGPCLFFTCNHIQEHMPGPSVDALMAFKPHLRAVRSRIDAPNRVSRPVT